MDGTEAVSGSASMKIQGAAPAAMPDPALFKHSAASTAAVPAVKESGPVARPKSTPNVVVRAQPKTALKSAKVIIETNEYADRTTYEKVRDSLGYVGTLGIGFALWLAGAYFTLEFLTTIRLLPAVSGVFWWAQWSIPIFISAMELALLPKKARREMLKALRRSMRENPENDSLVKAHHRARRHKRLGLGVLLVLALLDIGSSLFGLVGELHKQFPGLSNYLDLRSPESLKLSLVGGVILVIATAFCAAFAFLPEPIARWASSELWAIWADEEV